MSNLAAIETVPLWNTFLWSREATDEQSGGH